MYLNFLYNTKYFALMLVFCSQLIAQNGLSEMQTAKGQLSEKKTFDLYDETYNNKNHLIGNAFDADNCKCSNGKCELEGGVEVCKCPPGFGNFTKSYCKACNCGPDSNCMWIKSGWMSTQKVCICKPGYHVENETCVVSPCTSNPCKNGGKCEVSGNSFTCKCVNPYIGKTCETKCDCANGKCRVTSDGQVSCECLPEYGKNLDGVCEACKCGTGASCTWEKGFLRGKTKYCLCLDGSKIKTHCEDPCNNKPCLNNGRCRVEGKSFKCECRRPYIGPTCKDDLCTRNPCQHGGECKINGSDFLCSCKTPYSGKLCERDPCSEKPCENGGECSVHGNSFLCTCRDSYYGKRCEKVSSCTLNPCKNGGRCKDSGESFICTCAEPYSGETCEMDPCSDKPCENGGECSVHGNSFLCTCQDSYYGKSCEKVIGRSTSFTTDSSSLMTTILSSTVTTEDPCIGVSCQNGGICLKSRSSFACYCKPPYFGITCEKDPCTENPCENGGTCLQIGYSFKCQCRHPYYGDICQYDACSDNPCFNGGTCERDGDFFKCKCRSGYHGIHCEKD